MSQGFEIQIFNRYENKIDIEKVYGDGMVKFAYGNPIGRLLGPLGKRGRYPFIDYSLIFT